MTADGTAPDETAREQRRLQAELIDMGPSHDPFASAVRATRMPMIITDPRQPDNPVVFVNTSFCRLSGYTRDEIIGRNCRFLQGPETDPETVDRIRRALAAREAIEIDIRNYRKNGEAFWNRLLLAPVRDMSGEVAYFFASQVDVTLERERLKSLEASNAALLTELAGRLTEQRDSEDRLRLSEESLRLATEAAEIGTWDLDLLTDTLTWSDRTKALFGFPPDAAVSMRDFYAGLHPSDLAATSEAFAAALDPSKRTTYDVEYRTIGKTDGKERWVAAKGRGLFDATGRCTRALGTAIDVTARRDADARLRESERLLEEGEAKFRAITDSIDHMVWSTRPDGYVDFYNLRWYEFTGSRPGTTDGDAWSSVIHHDDRDRARRSWRASLETGDDYRIEYRLRDRHGVYRWVLGRAVAQRNAQGRVVRWFGTCTDIDEVVAARDVLARSRAELEREVTARTAERDRTWNNAQDLLLVIDRAGLFQAVNPAWEPALGRPAASFVGQSYRDVVHPDDVGATEAALAQAATEKLRGVMLRLCHTDGSYRWIEWVTTPDAGLIYASGRDVTAEKETEAALARAEEQLRQAQKMEAVGQLTGGIAHDFNNLLSGIMGSLELLQRRVNEGRTQGLERYTSAAITSAQRAAALTQRLLAFARRQPLDPRRVEANRLVAGMEDLLRRTLGPAVDLEMVLAGGLWPTLCDPNQLESAILNLAINARDAMPDGGRLTIETANAHLDDAYARAQGGEVRAGQYVSVSVTDTGTGMTADIVAKAFDPFFTTKPMGQGTGLGLSMLYGFVKQSEGHVRIYSEPGQGTTFKLYLPRHRGGEDASESEGEALAVANRAEAGETVLVVDDEAAVRMLVVETLEELGYVAVEASDGQTAMAIVRSGARIDLLVTDVGLPGLNGRQVAEAARMERPGLKVLFMTGYAHNAAVGSGSALEPGTEIISKPFALDALAAKIRSMIEGA